MFEPQRIDFKLALADRRDRSLLIVDSHSLTHGLAITCRGARARLRQRLGQDVVGLRSSKGHALIAMTRVSSGAITPCARKRATLLGAAPEDLHRSSWENAGESCLMPSTAIATAAFSC